MIGIFDSGIGGFTVYKQIKNLLPRTPTVYVADQKFMPYGTKSAEQILFRSKVICQYLANQNIQTVVVACNTATTKAPIQKLRSTFPNLKLVGIEPGIKPLVENTKTQQVAVLATSGTCNSLQTKQLIADHSGSIKVFCFSQNDWVSLIEANQINSKKLKGSITQLKQKLDELNIDVVSLSCTHFPLIQSQLSKYDPGRTYLDLSIPVAMQVKRIFEKTPKTTLTNPDVFYTTGSINIFKNQVRTFIGAGMAVESIDI